MLDTEKAPLPVRSHYTMILLPSNIQENLKLKHPLIKTVWMQPLGRIRRGPNLGRVVCSDLHLLFSRHRANLSHRDGWHLPWDKRTDVPLPHRGSSLLPSCAGYRAVGRPVPAQVKIVPLVITFLHSQCFSYVLKALTWLSGTRGL